MADRVFVFPSVLVRRHVTLCVSRSWRDSKRMSTAIRLYSASEYIRPSSACDAFSRRMAGMGLGW